jgi:hypothetical protein
LRRLAPGDPHPLTRAARKVRPRVYRHHLGKGGRKLVELAATLARGKTRRPHQKVEAEIGKILHDTWARRITAWQLDGDTPKDHRLTWHIDPVACAALEEEIFGNHVLITDHDDWPVAEVIAGNGLDRSCPQRRPRAFTAPLHGADFAEQVEAR